MDDRLVRVATFNCEWRRPNSADARAIRALLDATNPDVVCLTEAHSNFFGSHGHTIEALPNPTSAIASRRKVLLWSRKPWVQVDAQGPPGLPPNRFVSGQTETALGPVRFMGVCIPYRFAAVRHGSPKRAPWEVHLEYLSALDAALPPRPQRLVVLGDFNQRVPRKHQPARSFDALNQALFSRLALATAGVIENIGSQSIDHVCYSRDFDLREVGGLSNIGPAGRLISDHFGVHVSLSAAWAQ